MAKGVGSPSLIFVNWFASLRAKSRLKRRAMFGDCDLLQAVWGQYLRLLSRHE
jgi:hypothetical protein